MKTATSIRYGGIFIESDDCDYNSFKHLGLLCPICKRTVFLVKQNTRSATERKKKDGTTCQVKGSNVGSYFAHHPEVDRDTVNDCELKSKQITSQEKAYLDTESRNQRQKIFHAHFWKIILTSWMIREFKECIDYAKLVYIGACNSNETKASFMHQKLINTMIHKSQKIDEKDWSEFIKNRITVAKDRIANKWIETSRIAHEDISNALTDSELIEISQENETWNSEIDERMQAKIVLEAILFICQKKQVKILENLLKYTLDKAIHQIVGEQIKVFPPLASKKYAELYYGYMRQTIGATDRALDVVFSYIKVVLIDIFVSVRWAYQFQILEQKAKEKT